MNTFDTNPYVGPRTFRKEEGNLFFGREREESDLLALVVLTLSDTPADATANLMAPVLVNHRTRQAGQYVLTDVDLPIRAPLSDAGDTSPA